MLAALSEKAYFAGCGRGSNKTCFDLGPLLVFRAVLPIEEAKEPRSQGIERSKKQQRQAQEQQAEQAFRQKFTQGMERFSDFREVVGKLPMHDDMTMALRGMNDPTAFIYAAAKRQPGEIERISKLPDPYARMVEMGKLEERMRRNKATTKAPRPLGRTKEDTTARVTPKQKEMTGDDLLAKADAKRLSNVRNRYAKNR